MALSVLTVSIVLIGAVHSAPVETVESASLEAKGPGSIWETWYEATAVGSPVTTVTTTNPDSENEVEVLKRYRRSPTHTLSGYGLYNGLYHNGYAKPVQVYHQQPVYYYQQHQQPYTVHHYLNGGKDVTNTQTQTQTQSQAISASFGGSSISGAAASAASSSNTDHIHHQPDYLYGGK